MYDPSIGRWLSEDPIGFEAGDENLYRYVGNDPLNKIDPSGLEEWLPAGPRPPGYGSPIDSPPSGETPTIAYFVMTELFGRIIQLRKYGAHMDGSGRQLFHIDELGEFEKEFKGDIRAIIYQDAEAMNKIHDYPEGLNFIVHRSIRNVKNPNHKDGQWYWTKYASLDTGFWLNGAHGVDAEIDYTITKVGCELHLTNIKSSWVWRDEIDGRSISEWWNANETWEDVFKGLPNLVVESIFWDWWVDGFLDADYQIKIKTRDLHNDDIIVTLPSDEEISFDD